MPDTRKKAGGKRGEPAKKGRRSAGVRKTGERSARRTTSKAPESSPKGRNQEADGQSMSSVVELIKMDHEQVNNLFQEYETAADSEKQAIANKIMTELEIHAKIEEEIFYPAFRKKADKEGKELVSEALEEHKGMKELIKELKELESDDESFDEKLQELKEEVTHHVEEEESEMLPMAEEDLADKLDQLGSEMEQRKQDLMETMGVNEAS